MSKNSIRIRIMYEKEDTQMFKALISHPMESGYRRDIRTGTQIEADFIESLLVSIDNAPCYKLRMGENISKNPFIAFRLTQIVSDGQMLTISWKDNNLHQTRYDCIIQFDSQQRFNFNSEQHQTPVKQLTLEQIPACRKR